jgi:hypothetical protein
VTGYDAETADDEETTDAISYVLCPACAGTGVSLHYDGLCFWCGGQEYVSAETARCICLAIDARVKH